MKSNDRLEKESLKILREALEVLERGFAKLPDFNADEPHLDRIDDVLKETALRLRDNFPYFHPLYAGQMLKPPHPIARLAYMLALWINPNNHALDGGRASSAMEKEAVAEIAHMVGWKQYLGHLTGGGTMANLEALWIAGRQHPGKFILASDQSHYTHRRMCNVLGLPFETIPSDRTGRMDCAILEERLARGDVGTVVATMGTTALGSVDPLPSILALQKKFPFRLHADAAYGGYFKLSSQLSKLTRQSFDLLHEADSIVIDPHKHGLQPYGCGCVLFRDPAVGTFYHHDSPYTYFTSGDLHLGEISLECSRAGASAVALWATQRLLPLVKSGSFARSLDQSRKAAIHVFDLIRKDKRFLPGPEPELDILVWALRGDSVSRASEEAKALFRKAAENNLHLALAELPLHLFELPAAMKRDRDRLVCLRSVLMKSEHDEWAEKIWKVIDKAAG
ncbi:MAG: aminotransferase class I/II-fold pyridoxal phosphate-dependent enzyme [Bacteroidota bacterium]